MDRLKRAFWVAILTLAIVSPASAQTNSVRQHYRAYLAALESGDLTTARAEAEAALAASEARDGDGGSTAVLALNLATVHVMADDAEGALRPAQRALALARAGAAGVDPLMAELILARATLATDDTLNAANELRAVLDAPSSATLPHSELYAAAQQLGNWALARPDYEMARSAWSVAGRYPEGSVFGERYGLGRARTSEGIAIILSELRRTRGRMDEDEGLAAHALLGEAARALQPLSQVEAPTLELTLAQQTYAEARAWLLALEAKLDADGHDVPDSPEEAQGDADGLSEIGPVDLARPRCMMRVNARRLPSYPRTSQVGAVILFLRTNANGEIVSHQIAARAGAPEFAEAIERVLPHWRIERIDEQSAPNCRMEANILQSVRFILP